MGYPTRVQKIKRKASEQYYVNVPSAIARSVEFQKGEIIEWSIEDRTKLVIKRKKTSIPLKPKQRATRVH